MTKNHHKSFKFLAFFAIIFSTVMVSSAFAESPGKYVDDAIITAKVKQAILADSELKVLEVHVDTTHGVVLLSGAVDTDAQESEAIKDASQVDGVVSVTNNMSIKVTDAE